MPRLTPLAAAVLALATLSSCLSLPDPTWQPVREERFVRIDAARDRVEWVEIQHGLAPRSEFAQHLAEVLARRRVFPAEGGVFSLDYDGLDPHSAGCADLEAAAVEFLRTLQVDDARLVADENGCVALWRSGSLDRASAWLAAELPGFGVEGVPRQLHAGPLEWLGVPGLELSRVRHEDPKLDEFVLDDRTLEMLASADAAGERFWSLRGDSLCLDAPMTEASATRYLASVGRGEVGVRGDAGLGVWVGESDTSNERLRARFGPDESGWMRVAWTCEERLGDSVLCEQQARRMGFTVEPREAYLELRRAAGLPGPRGAE